MERFQQHAAPACVLRGRQRDGSEPVTTLRPDALTIGASLAVSFAMIVASASGVVPVGSRPRPIRRSLTSRVRTASMMARDI